MRTRKASDVRSGEGVARMSEPKDKAEEKEKPPGPKKPPGFRKFEKLLKLVVNAPPLRRTKDKPA